MLKICYLQGCSKPVHTDPVTQMSHNYCGRTHAKLCVRNVRDPHGPCHQCKLQGCDENVFYDKKTDRVHDFCSRDHARQAMDSRQWPKPLKKQKLASSFPSDTPICQLGGCGLPCCQNATSGCFYDFCGRTHAGLAKTQSSAPIAAPPPPITSKSVPVKVEPRTSLSLAAAPPPVPTRAIPPQIVTNSFNQPSTSSSLTDGVSAELKSSSSFQCVICHQDNANFCCTPCGHVCFCKEDKEKWSQHEQKRLVDQRQRGMLGGKLACPVCNASVDSLMKVQGLN